MPYSEMLVAPMRAELTSAGVQELRTAEEVDAFMAKPSSSDLLIVNSVCGCAAGAARPAVQLALGQDLKPERTATVFAGQDLDATAQARSHMQQIPPSSPSMALFRDGELVFFIPRHRIEGRAAAEIAGDLQAAFQEHCTAATV
ncbi:MAG: BrxA/BrxB family bacilliredoxin [Deltaproteobacteria bacterium]|nr:BrxA/BrxB family bacilliredoxin [Deltaproteobacteria bacterium]